MKIGIRKPSLKKSIKARTTGKVKRKIKGAVNPLYGKKGMGWINDPKKAAYNKVYNKTTVGVRDIVGSISSSNNSTINNNNGGAGKGFLIVLGIIFLPVTICYFFFKWSFLLILKLVKQFK